MKSLQNMIHDFKPNREPRECKIHGPFEAKLLVKRPEIWSSCPVCEAEFRAEKEVEAEFGRTRRMEENLMEAGILKRFRDKTFDNYRPQSEAQAQILEAVKGYADNFAEDFVGHRAAGRCLGLLGGAGQGKTHLGVALLKEVIRQGFTARYCREYDFFLSVKNTWTGGGDKRTETEIIQGYVRPDLLVLDEIGVQFFSRAEEALIFQVIENRYGAVKPTVVISNLKKPKSGKSREGDGNPLSRTKVEDVEDALGFRSYDRLIEGGGILLTFPSAVSYRRPEAVQ